MNVQKKIDFDGKTIYLVGTPVKAIIYTNK